MPYTYSGNPATEPRDAVRLLARDNRAGAMVLEDAEIAWLLSTNANAYMAAAQAVELIAVRAPGITSHAVGGTSHTFSVAEARAYADTLRQKGQSYVKPSAGGLPAIDADPYFKLGLHGHPENPVP